MTQFICQFTPAFLSLYLIERHSKKVMNPMSWLCLYGLLVGVINFVCIAIISIFFTHANHQINGSLFYGTFSYRYLAISFVIAWFLPNAYRILRKVISIELSVSASEDKGESL